MKYWWDQELNEFKQGAMSTNNDWVAAGKPRNGPVFEARNKSKYSYKKAIRQKHKFYERG